MCVCQKHQNSISAALDLEYKNLMKMIVCNENSICMIHRCDSCPGKKVLLEFLKNIFTDLESDDTIFFQQWKSTDRSDLKHIEMDMIFFLNF